MTDNLGQNVTIWFSPTSPWPGQSKTYHNVTHIHYNYRNAWVRNGAAHINKHEADRICFDSRIHGTSLTHPVSAITEFETTTAKEKHDEF